MKKENSEKNIIRQILEGRAARVIVVAVTVFLCMLTILEFVALRFEWDIPILQAFSGDNGFFSEEIQMQELALDDSTENELLELEETDEVQEQMMITQNNQMQEEFKGQQDKTVQQNAETEQNTEIQEDAEIEPEFPYYIKINRKENCITIYTLDEQGEYTVPHKAMICSTGLYNATPRGVFHISTKYRWRELYGNVYGQYATRIHGGVLFHSVPYYYKSNTALCTDKYNKLGQQASMGCVRLTVEDAKWIAENCPTGTTVEIYDSDDPGPLGKPSAMKIDTHNPNKGWDPTDPDMENPWNDISDDE